METEKHHRILKTLDHPPRVLFWPIDEFLVMMVPCFLGLCMGEMLLMLAGFLLKPLYARVRRRFPRGTLKHRLYWNLPKSTFDRAGVLRSIPPSHQRELLL